MSQYISYFIVVVNYIYYNLLLYIRHAILFLH